MKLYIQGRWIKFDEAMAYQINNGIVVPLNWVPEYITNQGQNVIHFTFDTYNPSLPLVLRIAPAPPPPPLTPVEPRNLGWSTYAGSDQGDEFMATGVDNNGDAYFCGYTNDINFPVNTGFQVFDANTPSFQGNHDAVVMKFRHSDKRILWATYLGGSEGTVDFSDVGIDQATDLAVYRGEDTDLEYVFVTGRTGCNDFPEPHFGDTPFQNAVHDDWGNTSSIMIHAAFIAAFDMENGIMHWGNSLGAGAQGFWTADGMGVDVNEEGTVAWVGRLSQVFGDSVTFDFNHVTPTGAFTQTAGGGFFALFDADYRYEWKTPFGTQCTGCGAFDVKLQSYPSYTFADIVGSTSPNDDAPIFSLDIATPDNFTGFQQTTHGGGVLDAYLARLDLEDHVNYYSTYWGGDENEHGTGLVSYDKRIWMVGGTQSSDLDAAHLPGNSGVHDATPGGGMDCFMLKFAATNPPPLLDFGALYGQEGDELWLDVAYNRNTVFFFGESTSADIVSFPDNPVLFRQDLLGNDVLSTQRDAVLLAIQEQTEEPTWNSLIGGFWTDRGWGVAASFDELYLCGGTRSDQLTFPLREWDTGAPEDWFDGDLLNNVGGDQGWYANSSQNFYHLYQGGPPFELGAPQTHDGFVASFYAPETVGFTDHANASLPLHPLLLDEQGLWSVLLPEAGQWSVYDAAGRLIAAGSSAKAGPVRIDLRNHSSGTYAMHALSGSGVSAYTKLFAP